MRSNVQKCVKAITYEGGAAVKTAPMVELERAVFTCLLFERSFYEGGDSIAKRIAGLCDKVSLEDIGALAITARHDLKLRHVPLWLVLQMLRLNSERKAGSGVVAQTIFRIVNRPDEMGKLLSLYWKEGRRPLAKQLKRGLALAFTKFSEYSLSKWNRDDPIKLRDVLFLCHGKPESYNQALLWKSLVASTLKPAGTWEKRLSAGEDKRQVWEDLLREKQLGIMALLMNLRNMERVGVSHALVEDYIREKSPGSWALPFRFLQAVKYAPAYAQALSDGMCSAVSGRLAGKTAVVIDVSSSMDDPISEKTKTSRWETAAALAVLLREVAEFCRVFTFSDQVIEVSNLRGLGLVQGIGQSQQHTSTYLRRALEVVKEKVVGLDRVVVVTDEQSQDGTLPAWTERAYLVNVASYAPALSIVGGWKRISGWSERLVDWIALEETGKLLGYGEDEGSEDDA